MISSGKRSETTVMPYSARSSMALYFAASAMFLLKTS